MASRLLWLALAGLLACRHASPPSPPHARDPVAPEALDAPAPAASTSSSSAPPPPPSPAATVSHSDYSGRAFRCGASRCAAGEQACCTSTLCPAEATCKPIDWAESGAVTWWQGLDLCREDLASGAGLDARITCPKLFAGCTDHKGRCDPEQGQNVDPKSCDDSRDCVRGICCTVGPDENSVCSAPALCEGNELCQDDAGCKTPGTRCVRGRCKSTRAHVACGGSVCAGATPVCKPPDWRISHPPGKTPPPRCRPYDAAEAGDFYECASARDCPDGQRCVWEQDPGDGAGTWENTVCRFAAVEGISPRTHTCDGDADCADVTAMMGDGRLSRCRSVAVGPTCLSLCDDGSEQEEMVGLPFALSMGRCGTRK